MPAAPLTSHIRVLPHIRRALEAGTPVVALESSVFAQGLPSPANAEAARRMIAAVEDAGCVAAITAVVCGQPTVGLDGAEVARFLDQKGIKKVSARDLGAATAMRADGATTVAAAIVLASATGIRTFATGGIGGVHRAVPGLTAHSTRALDESADLLELARTPMIVVCAGAKAILDLEATWERLDSYGVPVVGVGTDEFPGFFTVTTGLRLSVSVATALEAARIAKAHFGLGRNQSVLVVQPPPSNVALDVREVDRAVEKALERVGKDAARGGDVTPYLLAAVARATEGRSLACNLALLEANARLAAEIAAELVTNR